MQADPAPAAPDAPEGAGRATEPATVSRRAGRRRGRSEDAAAAPTAAPTAASTAAPTEGRPPAPSLSDVPLPRVRPAARHHSGKEYGTLRRQPHPPAAPKATQPRGMRLSKALLALVGSAVVAALAGAWAYHSWSGNRALSRDVPAPAAKAQVVILDGVADTSATLFQAGHTEQVIVDVDNPESRPVAVQGIEPGKVKLTPTAPVECTASIVKAVGEHNDLVIPPGGGTFDATVAMSKDAPPICNGIVFSVTFVVTGSFTTP